MASRPLTNEEIQTSLESLKNPRDKLLLIIGLRTGFRISEILSFKVSDVLQYGQIKGTLTVARKNMKGKFTSRSTPTHSDIKEALLPVLTGLKENDKLFPFTARHASRILKNAFIKAKLQGNVSTHSARKTFAKKMHDYFQKDLVKTQKALGHASISSTVHYISFDEKEVEEAILKA